MMAVVAYTIRTVKATIEPSNKLDREILMIFATAYCCPLSSFANLCLQSSLDIFM